MNKLIAYYRVLSPDGFDIELGVEYKTKDEAQTALQTFVKNYERQGYYGTVMNGERVRLPVSEIANNCTILPVLTI